MNLISSLLFEVTQTATGIELINPDQLSFSDSPGSSVIYFSDSEPYLILSMRITLFL